MTDNPTHPEPTRRGIVAFCESAWARHNESQAAKGEPPDRNVIARIERALIGDAPLYKVDFRQYYMLLGVERFMFVSYVLQQSSYSGKLQFVLWHELEEEEKGDSHATDAF